jgi:hypothetical protein
VKIFFETFAPNAREFRVGTLQAQNQCQILPIGAIIKHNFHFTCFNLQLIQVFHFFDYFSETLLQRFVILVFDLVNADGVISLSFTSLIALVQNGERKIEQLQRSADICTVSA